MKWPNSVWVSETRCNSVCYPHRVYRLHERLVNLRSDYNLRLKSGVNAAQVTKTQTTQQSSMKVRPEMDEVTLRYAQDLLAWVEENQRRIDEAQWGSDLPSVESHLGSHRGLHQSVEDFRTKIERAKNDEVDPHCYCKKHLRGLSHLHCLAHGLFGLKS